MLAWVMAMDPNGDTLWERTYAGGFGYLWSIVQTWEGGYVVAGRAGESRNRDLGVLKLDETGEPQWEFIAGGIHSDRARFVLQTSEKHFVVTGYTTSEDAGNKDFWLLKISEPKKHF